MTNENDKKQSTIQISYKTSTPCPAPPNPTQLPPFGKIKTIQKYPERV